MVVALVCAFVLVSGLGAPAVGDRVLGSTGVDNLEVNATSTLLFVPNQLTVAPGDSVHLVVIQLADFEHTFVLSPLPGFAFSSGATDSNISAFFAAHPPLVNLTLSSTPGSRYYSNFTAPAAGSYEFVCVVSGHFAAGMHGILTSKVPGSSNPAPAMYGPFSPLELAIVVLVLVALVIAALVLARRRTPPGPTPPPKAPGEGSHEPP